MVTSGSLEDYEQMKVSLSDAEHILVDDCEQYWDKPIVELPET